MRRQGADRRQLRHMIASLLVAAVSACCCLISTVTAFSPCPSSVSIITSTRSEKASSVSAGTSGTSTALSLYPNGYTLSSGHKNEAVSSDLSKHEQNGRVNRVMEQRLKNLTTNLSDIERVISLTKRGREIYVPDHLAADYRKADSASGSRANVSHEKKRGPIRNILRSIAKTTGLTLVLWQTAAYKPSSVVNAAREATKLTTSPYENARVIAPGRYRLSRKNVDKVVAATRQQEKTSIKMTCTTSGSGTSGRSTVITTARGGARGRTKNADAAKEPETPSASYKIRNHIINLAASTQSVAQSGIEASKVGVTKLNDMDPKTKAVGGAVAATLVGIGIGVEVAGRSGGKNKDDSNLTNTEKLRREISDEIDWYEKKYGTGSQRPADASSGGDSDGDSNVIEDSDSTIAEINSPGVRKPDPQAQVRAIIENAKETERKARIERRTSGAAASIRPSNTSGVDYSKVKGLSTTAGEGKDRVQMLVESTAEMERRAEAQRLENARNKDLVEEREALASQESLRNRIDSFITATEAEEKRHGIGNRAGDGGRAYRAEVARLNSELDRARTKMFTLEAELREKASVEQELRRQFQAELEQRDDNEAFLRKEIDRLRRSG